jgi:transposase
MKENDESFIESVRLLYQQGYGTRHIAAHLKVYRHDIQKAVKSLALPPNKPRYAAIPNDKIENVLKDFKSGQTIAQIQIKYKYSKRTISNILKQNGVVIKDIPELYINIEILNKVKQLYEEEGFGYVKIGKILKMGRDKVTDIVKENNFVPKDKSIIQKDSELEKLILDLYAQGLSMDKICQRLEIACSRKSIYKCLKRNNIRRRKITEYAPPMIGNSAYKVWVKKYGIEKANEMKLELKARQSLMFSGDKNPMFGKPSPNGSGVGYKGWYKGFYFRSLRELSYVINLDKNHTEWISCENKNFVIEYNFLNGKRTYRPDFFVKNCVIEIKPTRLHKTPLIAAKTDAAIKFCKEKGYKFAIIDFPINAKAISEQLSYGNIKFARDYEQKFSTWISSQKPKT